MDRFLLLILGMMAATAIPRILPAFLAGRWSPSPLMQRWLGAVPFAALGALIFPGIVTADAATPWTGIAAGVAAVIASWLRAPAYIAAFAAVGGAVLVRILL